MSEKPMQALANPKDMALIESAPFRLRRHLGGLLVVKSPQVWTSIYVHDVPAKPYDGRFTWHCEPSTRRELTH